MVSRFLISLSLLILLLGCAPSAEYRTVPVNGVEIGYRIVGQGSPLLMIMGYAGTMDSWDQTLVNGLAKEHMVILFDNRNVGRSTTSDAPVTMNVMADDAAGLLYALGYKTADVLGWSMGSVIAQEMALKYPDRVGKLVLYGAACEPEPVMQALKRFDTLTPEQFTAQLFPAEWAAKRPDIFGSLPIQAVPATPEAVARQREALARWPGTLDRLGKLKGEVLLVVGEEDTVTPASQSVKMAEAIDGSWLVRFKGGSHWLMHQNPRELDSIINGFLSGQQNLTP